MEDAMNVWIYSVISVVIVSMLSLMGVFALILQGDRLQRITLFLVSFAVGGLLGDAFIHLIPESFAHLGTKLSASLYVLTGILGFFVLEKYVLWRHFHVHAEDRKVKSVVPMILLGDAVHNFIDGALIGASYIVSIPLGVTTTLAVVLHELPHEIGDFGVLVHGGLPVKRALLLNFLTALTAIVGTVASLVVGPYVQGYAATVVPITAGGFIYIAGADLIPELQDELSPWRSLLQLLLILCGLGIMLLLLLIG
jgi:zinc and cadmium transporter